MYIEYPKGYLVSKNMRLIQLVVPCNVVIVYPTHPSLNRVLSLPDRVDLQGGGGYKFTNSTLKNDTFARFSQ